MKAMIEATAVPPRKVPAPPPLSWMIGKRAKGLVSAGFGRENGGDGAAAGAITTLGWAVVVEEELDIADGGGS